MKKFQILGIVLFVVFFYQKVYAQEVAGNTNIDLYGMIKQYFVWGSSNYTTPPPTYPATTAYKGLTNGYQFTNFQTYTGTTKLGMDINADKLQANIEGDFESTKNTMWLLKAYFKYKFSNNLFLLIGEYNPIGELNTFSDNYYAMPGFNQTWPFGPDQIRLISEFNTNDVTIKQEVGLEDLTRFFLTDDEINSKNISTKIPGIGAKLSINFPFLNNPARAYSFLETQQVYLDNKTSHWPYVYGTGISLPIKFITLQSELVLGKGATNYVGLIESQDNHSEIEVPNCFSLSGLSRAFRAYNIEANLTLNDSLSLYGGYDKVNFMNDLSSINQDIQSADGKFLGISYSLTKSTTLKLEYDIFKTIYYNTSESLTSASARQLFLSAEYDF